MTDVTVPRASTLKVGKVDGNLRLGEGARVQPEDSNPSDVSGEVTCEGDARFDGSLRCGRFRSEKGRIEISGDMACEMEVEVKRGELQVGGGLEARSVDVDARLTVLGSARADRFEVGGMLEVGESITARRVDVGGSFRVKGAAVVEDVDVGGRIELEGQVKISRLDAGGSARVGKGEVSNKIDVGGSFTSTGPLKFGTIDVGGTVTLEKGGEGHGIDVGGKFESRGDLSFETIDVGGTVDIFGRGDGDSVDVGGHLEVSGDLILKRNLEIGGKARVGGNLKLQSLEVGGLVEAGFIEAQDKVEVGGRLATERGTKAGTIELGSRSEARGVLVGTHVRIRDRARVEDIYADTVTLEEGVRARNLYFSRGHIESHCKISGEVLYTDTIEADSDVEFAKPAVKTELLPKPPI